MANTNFLQALPSGARIASGIADVGSFIDSHKELLIYIDVTAVSGTSPSMVVTYQSSPDGVTYYDNTAGTAITAVGKQLIKVPNCAGKHGRLSYAISGTSPSFTFAAAVEAK
jgi:hypothetical protein